MSNYPEGWPNVPNWRNWRSDEQYPDEEEDMAKNPYIKLKTSKGELAGEAQYYENAKQYGHALRIYERLETMAETADERKKFEYKSDQLRKAMQTQRDY